MNRTDVPHHLPAIGLDELVARAALLHRVDRKYVLPAPALPAVLAGLPADARVLQIGDRREFGYHSLYFDTPRLDSYLAAAHRRRRRFKVRIRRYAESAERFVEVKRRGTRGATLKDRLRYDDDALDPAARAWIETILGTGGLALAPALTTRYLRTTLFLPGCGSRVTIDRDLAWVLPTGTARHTPGRVIVETKSARGTSGLDRRLWALGHRPVPVSKYATGMAAMHDGLPANRWRPLLRRHFSAALSPPASACR